MPASKKKSKKISKQPPGDGVQSNPRLVSVRDFAKELGSSPDVIYRYVKQGIIDFTYSSGARFIDVEKAKAALAANGTRHAKMEPAAAPAGTLDVLADAVPSSVPTAGMTYAQAKAYRESFEARKKELDFNLKKGTLIEREEVEKAAFEAARITRESIMNVPDRISADLAAESDPGRVRAILHDALTQALASLSDKNIFQSKPAPLVAPQPEETNAAAGA